MSNHLAFSRCLPKVELHLHIEGTFEPELLFEIAKRNNISLPFANVDELRKAYDFTGLQSFLDLYYQGHKVLCTRCDFRDLTYHYFVRAHKANLKHVEIFFDAQEHVLRGVPLQDVVLGIKDGCDDAKKDFGISSEIILCFLRHYSPESAMEILQQALPYKEHIIGVGMCSSEAGIPPERYAAVFKAAKENGFRLTAHAGEEGPADYVRQAVELLECERIDHGTRCVEDDEVVKMLADKKIALTMCPLSNVALKVVPSVSHLPIPLLMEKGVRVTLNSDDPAYFRSYVDDNYDAVLEAFNLTPNQLAKLSRNAIDACWADDQRREELENALAAVCQEYQMM